jgi:molybdopterin-guanine dinucleotide biosynthesis protein A
MGTDKALLELDGRPLIAHVATTLQTVCEHVVLSANDPQRYQFLGLETIEDDYGEHGPLGGIYSALAHTLTPAVFILACDTPYVSHELVRYIIEYDSDADAKIPSMNGNLHPLCGMYQRHCLTTIQERLENQQNRVQDLFSVIPTEIIPISPALPFYKENLFANLNLPSDVHDTPGHRQERP